MAGVGKSTLATYLYNLKRSDFSRSCFWSEIRKTDLPSLQRKLLRDLLGCDFDIEDTRKGKGIFRDRLLGLQSLVVLDDADHIDQINSLLVTDAVGSRSLILITSRDQDLLRRSSPKTFLGRGEQEYWKPQLEKLSRKLPDDIMDRLKVSYKALNSEAKDIFLDKEIALRVFQGLGYKDVCDCLENLRQRCLIEYHHDEIKCRTEEPFQIDGFVLSTNSNDSYDYLYLPMRDKIAMNDHIRDLARHIAREEFGVLPPRKHYRSAAQMI